MQSEGCQAIDCLYWVPQVSGCMVDFQLVRDLQACPLGYVINDEDPGAICTK